MGVLINTNSTIYKTVKGLYDKYIPHKQTPVIDDTSDGDWKSAVSSISNEVHTCESNGGRIGIYIKDMNSSREITYNKLQTFNAASLYKLPVMSAIFRSMEKYPDKFTEEDKIKINNFASNMIIKSDNIACSNLIFTLEERFGYNYLNDYCNDIGMTNTADYQTCPADIGLFLEKLYKKELFTDTNTANNCINMMRQNIHKNRIPVKLPDSIKSMIAHKTGTYMTYINDFRFIEISCHDAAIVYTPRGNYTINVMIEFKVSCNPQINSATATNERGMQMDQTVSNFMPKGNKTIQDISRDIYYRYYYPKDEKPEPVL